MVRSFILFCIVLFPCIAFTQQQDNQELNKRLGAAKNAVDSSLFIRDYIMETGAGSPENAFELLQKSKNLLKNTSDEKLWAEFYFTSGKVYLNYGEYDKALEELMKSYAYYKPDNPGNAHQRKIIESYFTDIYMKTNHYSQAEIYMKKSHAYAVEQKDPYHIARSQVNLGWLYLQMYLVHKDSSKLTLSLPYFRKGFPYLVKHSENPVRVQLNLNYADIFSTNGMNDSAQYYYQNAIQLLDEPEIDAPTKAWVYSQYARHFHDINLADSAVFYAEKAFDIVKDGDPFTKLDVAKTLYKSYILQKDYEKATGFFEKYTELQDSLEQTEKYANIKTLIYQQQNPRKDSWIERNWVWVSVSALAVFFLVFISVMIKQKKKLRKAEVQLTNLAAKINSLNTIIRQHKTEIGALRNNEENNLLEAEDEESRLKEILSDPILTDDQWLTFKKAFEKVNVHYSKKIHQRFSNISQAELRYLYLKKLGLTHKEMAAVLGISPDSLRSYKHRLRKKIKPGQAMDLFESEEAFTE